MRKPFRLGLFLPIAHDGTSFYRGAGPIGRLMKSADGALRCEAANGPINWVYFSGIDGLFLQRPFTPEAVQLLRMAKANACPSWVDYDDDLLSVPIQNPTYPSYSNTKTRSAVIDCLILADVVTVSTPYLKARLLKVLEEVHRLDREKNPSLEEEMRMPAPNPDKFIVLPNAYDAQLFSYSHRTWSDPVPEAERILLWRGSKTHDMDLETYTVPLIKAFLHHGLVDWSLGFFGEPSWRMLREMKRQGIKDDLIQTLPAQDIMEFMRTMFELKPAAVHVPLYDDPFNRAKSNIAWIEATHAGAVTLAPDWDEWRRPGIITYKDQEDFGQKIAMILKGDIMRGDLVEASRHFISENLLLSHVNRIREHIIWDIFPKIDVWQ